MAQILCSTGALIGRPNNRDYRLLKEFVPQLQCDGFEFMMYGTWYEERETIIEFLKENQIHTPVMHCEKNIGEAISKGSAEDFKDAFERFEINCDIAKKIDAKKMVIHLWDGITSDQNFENNKKAYATLSEIANRFGVDLLVENVVCNKNNPMQHWVELAETYQDIHFIFDTKMAAFHQQEHLLYEKEYEWLWKNGQLRHFHVNDYQGASCII